MLGSVESSVWLFLATESADLKMKQREAGKRCHHLRFHNSRAMGGLLQLYQLKKNLKQTFFRKNTSQLHLTKPWKILKKALDKISRESSVYYVDGSAQQRLPTQQ